MMSRSRNSHVSAQPNIDDLMCAGMSSGPAKLMQFNIQTWKLGKDHRKKMKTTGCASRKNKDRCILIGKVWCVCSC